MEGRTIEIETTRRDRALVWLACGPLGRAYSFARDLLTLAGFALHRLARRLGRRRGA